MADRDQSDGPPPEGAVTVEALPRPSSSRQIAFGIAAVALVIAVGVGAYFIAGGGDDAPDVAADVDDAAVDLDTTGVTYPFEAQFVEVEDPVRFSFAVPSDWVVLSGFPVRESGAEVVPDPALAAAIDRLLSSPPAMVLAVDPSSEPDMPAAVAVYLQRSPATTSAAEWAAQTRSALGDEAADAVIEEVDGVATLRYRPVSGGGEVVTVQSFRPVEGGMLAFVAVSDDPGIEAVVEAIAGGVDT